LKVNRARNDFLASAASLAAAGTVIAMQHPPDGTGLIAHDSWLTPYADSLRHRYARYKQVRAEIIAQEQCSLADFALGHRRFGFNAGNHNGVNGVWYREWAPNANGLSLIGDFNGWDQSRHVMTRDSFGVWSVFVPDSAGSAANPIESGCVKVRVFTLKGASDRLPAYVQRVLFDADGTNARGVVQLASSYQWVHNCPPCPAAPRIYEAHVGMSSEQGRIATFDDFRTTVLPRVVGGGYNTIQFMAVQEHPYYGSFGYHVSNFFAVSSRFGTPDDFRRLVDAVHGAGVRVVMDLVHSHSVKNTVEGLNGFDGTDHQYFHAGPKGQHPAWDSLLFDYSKREVQRFLLSNIRYWLDEFRVDGFRFDGVTSMMYQHHGLGQGFSSYDDYLRWNIDEDALTYLQLANEVTHTLRPDATCIAEDVSGMVGLCRPLEEGGIGFNYRLAMGLPDYWIGLLRERRDEDWKMDEIFSTLANRRHMEAHISYCESHDQALVGDKTIAFWLMDKEMYWHMNKGGRNATIDRGIALHKLIRLLTFAIGGEGYLNFMGNEFGHPEWIDFPRAGNNWSFHYCRRQWSLADNPELRYQGLAVFDAALQALDENHQILSAAPAEKLLVHEEDKLLVLRRGQLIFAFNLHPDRSRVGVMAPLYGSINAGDPVKIILNTDAVEFGGFGSILENTSYTVDANGADRSVSIYLPARTAQVLRVGK